MEKLVKVIIYFIALCFTIFIIGVLLLGR